MTDLDYAIQQMRDAIDVLERGDDNEEALDAIRGGLSDAYLALDLDNPDD